jgi:hypothetical protein
MRQLFLLYSVISVLVIAIIGSFWASFLWVFVLLIPLVLIGFYDMTQTQHSLWRNYPLMARWRWVMEALRGPCINILSRLKPEVHPLTECFAL